MKLKLWVKFLLVLIIILVIGVLIFTHKEENLDNKNEIKEDVKDIKPDVKKDTTYTAKLTMVGDFLFEQPYYNALDSGEDINRYFSLVKDYFSNDDLSIGNMEVVIGDDTMKMDGGLNYVFCAPSYIGKLVASLDLEVLSTANNHAFDRGIKGVNSTIDFFRNNTDIMTVGTFKNEEERKNEHILEINNIKFGFLSYTMGTNIKMNKNERYSIALSRDPDTGKVTDEYKEIIRKEVNNLKDKTDVVIVMMHWGSEFTYTPSESQKEMAIFLNSLGVDIIVGSHSHSIQPIEWIGDDYKTLVYYSMGNFVSADDDIARTGEEFDNAYQVGLLSQLEITKKDDAITIDNITTEPIVNYFDSNMRNFLLIPFKDYSSNYEVSHFRYKYNFNKEFIDRMYKNVIKEEFR